MGSLIQRLETLEVIEFKKKAFLLTQDLAGSSEGPISHLSAVSPL